MRFLKMFGLAALAALASMAFLGAGSASADTLCKANQEPCSAANTYAKGTPIVALSNNAQLLAGSVETICHSEVEGLVGESLGAHKGHHTLIDVLTFSDCVGDCEFVTNDEGENLPYLALAFASTNVLHVTSDGGGNPAALLNNCSAFNFDCLYQTSSALLTILEGNNPTIHANVTLSRSGHSGFCPATAGWHATYNVSTPKPLWLSLSP